MTPASPYEKVQEALQVEEAAQKEEDRIQRAAARWGLSVEEYEKLRVSGKWKAFTVTHRRQRRKEERIRDKKYVCPRCHTTKTILEAWCWHGHYCKACSYLRFPCKGCGREKKTLKEYAGIDGLCARCIAKLQLAAKQRKQEKKKLAIIQKLKPNSKK